MILFVFMTLLYQHCLSSEITTSTCTPRADLEYRIVRLRCQYRSNEVYVFRGESALLKYVDKIYFNTFGLDSKLFVKVKGVLEGIFVEEGEYELCKCFHVPKDVVVEIGGRTCLYLESTTSKTTTPSSVVMTTSSGSTVMPTSSVSAMMSTSPRSTVMTTSPDSTLTTATSTVIVYITPYGNVTKDQDEGKVSAAIYAILACCMGVFYMCVVAVYIIRKKRNRDHANAETIEMPNLSENVSSDMLDQEEPYDVMRIANTLRAFHPIHFQCDADFAYDDTLPKETFSESDDVSFRSCESLSL